MSEAVREVLEAITRHRLRALATAFGVFWGIFMLTILLAGGSGLRSGLFSIFEGNAENAVWIEPDRTSSPYQGLGAGREITLDIQDVRAITRGMPELENVSPRQLLPPRFTISRGTRSVALPAMGIYDTYAKIEMLTATRGRLLNRLDVERARKVAVIGVRAREVLFGDADPVGETIAIGGVELRIVGEYEDPEDDEARRVVYLPYTTLVQSFDNSPKVQMVLASMRKGADQERIKSRLKHMLARRHRFDPEDASAVYVWFLAEEFKRLQELMRGIDLGIAVVGLGTLVSGMVGVSNILFVSVRERAKEFGVRRALGATARSILGMVIAEALALALAAGGLGLCVALGLIALAPALGIESAYFRDPRVDAATALSALSVLVMTALFAGYFPAREAARVTPIDALRRE